MKEGDLVKYSEFPHYELSQSGMVGLVLEINTFLYLEKVYVKWCGERPQGNLQWEYVNELEIVSEVR